MAQTQGQRRASDAVAAQLASWEWNNSRLVAATGVDSGTIGDFLNGKRWPKIGTQGKIEKAMGWPGGTLRQVAAGQDPPPISQEPPGSSPPDPSTPERVDLSAASDADLVNELRRRLGGAPPSSPDGRGLSDVS